MPHPNIWAEGCCYVKGSGYAATTAANTSLPNRTGIYIDASKSNPIYGNSTTVQPPAVTIVAWKRES